MQGLVVFGQEADLASGQELDAVPLRDGGARGLQLGLLTRLGRADIGRARGLPLRRHADRYKKTEALEIPRSGFSGVEMTEVGVLPAKKLGKPFHFEKT